MINKLTNKNLLLFNDVNILNKASYNLIIPLGQVNIWNDGIVSEVEELLNEFGFFSYQNVFI